jgi:hypothetical protein
MINLSKYSSKYYFPKNINCNLFLLNFGSINFAKEIIKRNNVEVIYYKSKTLEKYLNKNNLFANIKKIYVNENFLSSFLFLLLVFIKIKFKKNFVFFFHESSWIEFDILINLIKPKGFHYLTTAVEEIKSQIKIDNFFSINKITFSKKIKYTILKFFFKNFNFYYRKINLNNLPIFIFCNFYHSKIKKYFFLIKEKNITKNKHILFLVSKNFISSKYDIKQKEIYDKLINKLSNSGYQCYVKDHPRKSSRLNFLSSKSLNISTDNPIELYNHKFEWVIGSTSSSLFNFEKSISVAKLYMKDYDFIEFRKLTLKSLANHVLMPNKISKIVNLIIKK